MGEYKGHTLVYGRKIGFGCYGPPPGMQRGARVFELISNGNHIETNTWIRLADGRKVQKQSPGTILPQVKCHCDDC